MSTSPISHRTTIRDAVLAMFESRRGADGMRVKEFDMSRYWIGPDQCARFPTYCVLVTDEVPGEKTQRTVNFGLTLTVVIYAKDDHDPRRALDAAIEDVYETMLLVQDTIDEEISWQFSLQELSSDDGTSIAHPYALAVQRWQCEHRRPKMAA